MTLILIAILLLCVLYFDFFFFIIPNFIPLGIVLLSLIHIGISGESFNIPHIALPLIILFIGLIFAYFNILGFGDSKFIASLSIIFSVQYTAHLLFYTVMLGAFWAIIFIVFKKSIADVRDLLYSKNYLYRFHMTLIPDLDQVIMDAKNLQEQNHLPYGLAIAPAAIYVLYTYAF